MSDPYHRNADVAQSYDWRNVGDELIHQANRMRCANLLSTSCSLIINLTRLFAFYNSEDSHGSLRVHWCLLTLFIAGPRSRPIKRRTGRHNPWGERLHPCLQLVHR